MAFVKQEFGKLTTAAKTKQNKTNKQNKTKQNNVTYTISQSQQVFKPILFFLDYKIRWIYKPLCHLTQACFNLWNNAKVSFLHLSAGDFKLLEIFYNFKSAALDNNILSKHIPTHKRKKINNFGIFTTFFIYKVCMT